MTDFGQYLLDLYGPDPFSDVRQASEVHRLRHAESLPGGEQECGVYPSDALKMRAVSTIVRAAGARRVLEIGGGLGYSALWIADAISESGRIETIDRFPDHVEQARDFATKRGMDDRVVVLEGEGDSILRELAGPYDVIHDDGWFAAQPPYYDRLADLLRPGGLLVMSNWFLLEHAVTGESPLDWAQFAGKSWAEDVKGYAERLVNDSRYEISFVRQPSFALAWRRTTDA